MTLPEKLYVTTTLILKVEDKYVIIGRKNPPYGFALPGGFLEPYLDAVQNGIKEGKEETNLEIDIINPTTPMVYSSPKRDPRSRVVDLVFIANGSGNLKAGSDAKQTYLLELEDLVSMFDQNKFAFDHEEILKTYLRMEGLYD